jgi:hypothetical protein
MAQDDLTRWWAPNKVPSAPKEAPGVPLPGANTNPYGGSAAPVMRAASQFDAVKQQLDRSLNDAADTAVSASYAGIAKQQRQGGRY